MAKGGERVPREDNLTHKLTAEERALGGRKSGEKRRLQAAIKKALESKAEDERYDELFERFGIDKKSRSYAMAIACAIVQKAAGGDLSSAAYLRDTAGEKKGDEPQAVGRVVIVDDLKT